MCYEREHRPRQQLEMASCWLVLVGMLVTDWTMVWILGACVRPASLRSTHPHSQWLHDCRMRENVSWERGSPSEVGTGCRIFVVFVIVVGANCLSETRCLPELWELATESCWVKAHVGAEVCFCLLSRSLIR